MISLRYIVQCDYCKKTKSKEIIFDNVDTLLENKRISNLWKPALPKGWFMEPTKRAGQPDSLFCCPGCKIAAGRQAKKI